VSKVTKDIKEFLREGEEKKAEMQGRINSFDGAFKVEVHMLRSLSRIRHNSTRLRQVVDDVGTYMRCIVDDVGTYCI
jgi:hypothetical protein